jgi:putative ABC transport system substrate-binding protein
MTVTIGRRELLAALGSAATWPLAARAQQAEGVRRMGVLENALTLNAANYDALPQSLRELGYVEGRNSNWSAAR